MSHLRFVTKFDAVEPLLSLNHSGHTRFRCSLNADAVARRLEGGTPKVEARIKALRKMALPKAIASLLTRLCIVASAATAVAGT